MRSILLAAAATVAATDSAVAQADEDQIWIALTASGPIAKDSPFLAGLDIHDRSFASSGDRDVTILRPGFGYRVSPSLDLWVGYAWITTARDGADLREERFWQQGTYPLGEFLGGQLTGRTRLEQRLRDGDDDVGLRLRQQFRFAYRFTDSSFGLVAWNEIFLGMNETDWGQPEGFDQNRLFAGISLQAQDRVRLEAGYLNQIVNRSARDLNRDNIQLSATISF